MRFQLLAIFLTIAFLLTSCALAAPLLRRSGRQKFRLLSESTEQFLVISEDGLVRNDANKQDATCFEIRRPTSNQVQLSATIEGTEYFLAMGSNGEVTGITEVDDDSSESGSGVVYFTTFERFRCPFGREGKRGMCLKMTIGDTQCFLNFNSNHLAANSCSKSAKTNEEALKLKLC